MLNPDFKRRLTKELTKEIMTAYKNNPAWNNEQLLELESLSYAIVSLVLNSLELKKVI